MASLGSSIRTEIKRNISNITDFDNFKNRYYDSNRRVSVIYPSFETPALEQSFFTLLQQSKKFDFKNRWDMRPDYTSYDLYKTTIYWPIILYLNNIYSIIDYTNLDSILAPPLVSIIDLTESTAIEPNIVNIRSRKLNRKINKYYKKYPLNPEQFEFNRSKNILLEAEKTPALDVYTREIEEEFELTQEDVNNKFITLTNEPDNFYSVNLFLNNYNVPQRYNHDYIIKSTDDNKMKILSWNLEEINKQNTHNIRNNMTSFIKAGTIIRASYNFSIIYRVADGPPII